MKGAITLAKDPLYEGAAIGLLRRLDAIVQGKRQKWGTAEHRVAHWGFDIEGSLAERAAALLTGQQWKAAVKPDAGKGDVGELEVRYAIEDHYCLRLDADANPRQVYALVTGREGSYVMRGCLPAGRGMRPEFWRRDLREPCYLVPQRYLDPPDEWLL